MCQARRPQQGAPYQHEKTQNRKEQNEQSRGWSTRPTGLKGGGQVPPPGAPTDNRRPVNQFSTRAAFKRSNLIIGYGRRTSRGWFSHFATNPARKRRHFTLSQHLGRFLQWFCLYHWLNSPEPLPHPVRKGGSGHRPAGGVPGAGAEELCGVQGAWHTFFGGARGGHVGEARGFPQLVVTGLFLEAGCKGNQKEASPTSSEIPFHLESWGGVGWD